MTYGRLIAGNTAYLLVVTTGTAPYDDSASSVELSECNLAMRATLVVVSKVAPMKDSDNPGPAVQRRRLRTELQRARLDAGLTQEQVASAMDWSLSKVIRIENGSVNISTNDLKAILQHYKITDEDRISELIALSRAAGERSWWSRYHDLVALTTDPAHRLRDGRTLTERSLTVRSALPCSQ